MRCAVRLFVDVDSPESAYAVLEDVARRIPFPIVRESVTVQKYWKIEEWDEVFFDVDVSGSESQGDVAVVLKRFVDSLGTGWEVRQFEDEGFGVWTKREGATFAVSEVQWVCVECFPG